MEDGSVGGVGGGGADDEVGDPHRVARDMTPLDRLKCGLRPHSPPCALSAEDDGGDVDDGGVGGVGDGGADDDDGDGGRVAAG